MRRRPPRPGRATVVKLVSRGRRSETSARYSPWFLISFEHVEVSLMKPNPLVNPTVSSAVRATANRLLKHCRLRPTLGLVLGSGFQSVLSEILVVSRLPYAKLEGFPQTSVAGHAGELIIGTLGSAPVYALSGRVHYYEGQEMDRVTFAIRVLAAAGVRDLLLTNAAGAINRRFRPGDFMQLTDHINLMGVNPLRGRSIPGFSRFVDLTRAYDPALAKLLWRAARAARIALRQGVYLAVSGPSYETPAEIQAFARLGADAVGMSTVPETIVARQLGLRVAALSCITNLGAGLSRQPLSHQDVLKTAERVKTAGARLLLEFGKAYAQA